VIRIGGARPASTLAVMAAACLMAAWAVGHVGERREAAGRDQREVAHMTASMKTVCIGRFLIDLPATAQVALSKERIDGLDIATFEESREEFMASMAARQSEIASTPDRLGGDRNLETVREVQTASGMEGKIFMHGRKVTEGTAARGLDIEHYRYEGIAIEAMVHGRGITLTASADNYRLDLVDNLERLISLAVPNPDNRIPLEPGFCVNKAYFRDTLGADQNETIMMMANLPSHPDIGFELLSIAGVKPASKGLLGRRDESSLTQAMIARLWVKTLRAAPRIIGDLTGEEIAERVTEQNDVVGHTFQWEVNGTEHDVLEPHLSFMMSTGGSGYVPVPASLSDDAATELWDRIVSSIRHRPVAAQHAPPATQPEVALGTRATAGETCIHAGWWQCGDAGRGVRVLGGSCQYIAQGGRMPQALLLPAQGVWQRLRGLQPSFESATPTVWQLADRRERDRRAPAMLLASAMPADASAPDSGGAGVRAVPIGSLAATGQPCPASGWWRCDEMTALDGARWFAQGSVLPAATFLAPRTRFGLPFGQPDPITRRSNWQLMRLAGGDPPLPGAASQEDGAAHPPSVPLA